LTTSEIEGEILDRASVQSSIRKQMGQETDRRRVGPAEEGIAEMMVDLRRSFGDPLSEDMLFRWRLSFSHPRHSFSRIQFFSWDRCPEPPSRVDLIYGR
jgi:hypothetical protein